MKKTSLYLDPELDRAIARRAEEAGISKAEFIRRSLGQATHAKPRAAPRGRATFRGPADLAENLDPHLDELGFGGS